MSDQKIYWKQFYENKPNIQKPSDFCFFIIDYFKNIKNIKNVMDSGCGNGRDSNELSKIYNVTGVDNWGFIFDNKINFDYKIESFIDNDKTNYDLIYSRFTFHSITNNEQVIFLKTIPKNAYLAIEARSIKDMDNEVFFGKDHYRNYIDIEHLKKILYENNFQILYIEEGPNMAKYKDENNICIRTICKKK